MKLDDMKKTANEKPVELNDERLENAVGGAYEVRVRVNVDNTGYPDDHVQWQNPHGLQPMQCETDIIPRTFRVNT